MKLYDLTLMEALDGLTKKDFSSVELTQSYLDRMAEKRDLNAYITETPERAMADAKASDDRRAAGSILPLDGLPISHKDLFCTKGIKTTAASKILENFIPPYESTVSQNLQNAGTVLLGKTNLDQFGMGATCRNSAFGPTTNPHTRLNDSDPLVAGGSSGGAGAALAGGLCIGATGTDTGGSLRVPASFCGVVSMKTTYSLCSRWGCIAYASSFDTPGVLGRTVADTAILLEHMTGHDAKDSTSSPNPRVPYSKSITPSVKGLKIGLVKECDVPGLSPEIKEMWQQKAKDLEAQGAEIVEISLPNLPHALAAYYVLIMAEVSSNLARYDGIRYGLRTSECDDLESLYKKTRLEGFKDESRRRILIGTFVLSSGFYDAYFLKAAKVRRLIANDYMEAFKKVDALLIPTTPSPAFNLDKELSPIEDYATDIFAVSASLAGICSLSVPTGFSKTGLPLSLQIQGNQFQEQRLFNIGSVLESVSPKTKRPSEIC